MATAFLRHRKITCLSRASMRQKRVYKTASKNPRRLHMAWILGGSNCTLLPLSADEKVNTAHPPLRPWARKEIQGVLN
jgi:hypothetical protein